MNRWNKEELEAVIKNSFSLAQTIRNLGLGKICGGNYEVIKRYIRHYNIDCSHFTGKGWARDKKFETKPYRTFEEILVQNSTFSSTYHLKNRLLKAGLLNNKCYICSMEAYWNGRPLNLHLDHINGISNDHRIENLRLLCPNCHSQTETYTGKNKKKKSVDAKSEKKSRQKFKKECKTCNGILSDKRAKNCFACYQQLKKTKIIWPTAEKLQELVLENSLSQLAKIFGVSDKAIAKRCKRLKIERPPTRCRRSFTQKEKE
jgi:hypothetical protein